VVDAVRYAQDDLADADFVEEANVLAQDRLQVPLTCLLGDVMTDVQKADCGEIDCHELSGAGV